MNDVIVKLGRVCDIIMMSEWGEGIGWCYKMKRKRKG